MKRFDCARIARTARLLSAAVTCVFVLCGAGLIWLQYQVAAFHLSPWFEPVLLAASFLLILCGLLFLFSNHYWEVLLHKHEDLRDSERRYRSLVESQRELVVRATPNGRITFLNSSFSQLFGNKISQHKLKRSLLTYVHPDEMAMVKEAGNALRNPPYRTTLEVRIRIAGSWRWLSWEAFAIRNEDGKVIEVQAVGRDVTDHHQALADLQSKERYLANVFASIHDGISVLDADYTICRVNSVLENGFSGRLPLVGQKCYSAYHERDSICPWCPTKDVLATGKPASAIIGKDAGRAGVWDELYCFPMMDPDTGAVTGVIEYIRDVTERKRTEEELQASEATNRALLHAIPDIILHIDREGQILWIHAVSTDDLISPPGMIPGKKLAELLPNDIADRALHSIEQTLTTGEMQVREFPLDFGSDRRFFEIRLVACGAHDVLAIVRNVTQAKRVEEEIRALNIELEERVVERTRQLAVANTELASANEALKEADRAKDLFLAHLSHELLTPLTSILGWSKLALNGNAPATLMKESLAVIDRNARRQQRLVGDLLDITKIAHGKLALERENCDLNHLAEQAIESCMQVAGGRGISLALETCERPVLIFADAVRIVQVLTNLLNNALKFTKAGGSVKAQVHQDGKNAVVFIRDTGVGIPSQQLESLFEPFRQFQPSGGLGLGLSLVKGLVEEHGGSIAAESNGIPGEGSLFTITLPLIAEKELEQAAS